MRKNTEPKKAMTLYIPEELSASLDQYMLDHYGKTYGRNEVINEALREFIGRSNAKSVDSTHTSSVENAKPVGNSRHNVTGTATGFAVEKVYTQS